MSAPRGLVDTFGAPNIHNLLCLMSWSSGSKRCLPRISHNCTPRKEHLLWAELNEEVFAG